LNARGTSSPGIKNADHGLLSQVSDALSGLVIRTLVLGYTIDEIEHLA
jgi:hypothetical protein